MPEGTRPKSLSPGEALAVIAPSGGFSRERLDRGIALLRESFDVRPSLSLEGPREGYLAASDAARLSDLHAALADPDVKAIVAARGGFGATRLLEGLDLQSVRRHPRWLVGFSDVTALHAAWANAGLCSLHAPVACSLPEGSEKVQRAVLDVLQGAPCPAMRGETWIPGKARGPLRGGNLAVLAALAGTPHAPDLRGAVLFLEDVGERPYRLDRMLTTLRQSAMLRGVVGIALGQFTACDAGEDGTPWQDAVHRNVQNLGVPVLANLPAGHVADNFPLLLGATVELDADAGQLRWV